MLTRPKFKTHLRIEPIGDCGIALLSEREHHVLEGPIFMHLAPLLDGEHTVDRIIEILEDKISLPEIYYALELLKSQGHVAESDDCAPSAQAVFWSALGADRRKAREKLANGAVALHGVGDLSVAPFAEAFASVGINVCEEGEVDFAVVLTDDYARTELRDFNRRALGTKQAWMLAKPTGTIAWIGPIFRPGLSACWECLDQRLRSNRQMESYIQSKLSEQGPIIPAVAAMHSTIASVAHIVATDVARWLVVAQGESSAVRTLDLLTLDSERHALMRRPQCPSCGDERLRIPDREPTPITLSSQPVRFAGDGGYRICTPSQTLKKFNDLVSPITGVVTSLTRIDGSDESDFIFTYAAGHNFALIRNETYFLLRNIRGRSGGKGMSDTQARVSGLCEGIERYSGLFSGDEIRRRATYRELGERALFPPSYLLYSEAQYERRSDWSHDKDSDFQMVPERFDESRAIDWTPLWSLTNGGFRYAPTAFCYYGHPDIRERFDTSCDSNGNAAGNVIEEALLQGFLELAERDAVAIWWYNRVRRPRVDLASFDEPYIHALTAHYRTLGREFWVLDITNDLGIPTFAAVSRRIDKPVEDIVLGFGAHLDPRIALLRSITEINQFMPTVSGNDASGETIYSFDDPEAIRWWKTATVVSQPYVTPDDNATPRARSDFRHLATGDLAEDVRVCVQLAAEKGLETFALDQTRPDIGLSVVKVVVPGLRHFWKRFAPGRLYDVPVKLGWLGAATAEADLNSIGIFF